MTEFADAIRAARAGPGTELGHAARLLADEAVRLQGLDGDAAERIPAILRRATSWLVNPDGATIHLAPEDAAALDAALAEFGHATARECVSAEIVVRVSRRELGELIDAIAFTVSPNDRANAPLLKRLQALYTGAGSAVPASTGRS